jgi:ABC-type nickel/cobalt efflux system permease component RcnA
MTEAARFVGWLLIVGAVLPLTALTFTSSFRSWEAIAPVLLAGIALSWCVRSIVTRYGERRDALSSIDRTVVDAEAFLAAGDRKRAAALAANALRVAVSPRNRKRLWKVVTWSAIADRAPFSAHEALSHLPPRALDVHLVAAYLDCCNRAREGVELLERARAMGVRSAETTKLLIELHHREGDAPAVRALLASDAALLSQQDRVAIESALAALAG